MTRPTSARKSPTGQLVPVKHRPQTDERINRMVEVGRAGQLHTDGYRAEDWAKRFNISVERAADLLSEAGIRLRAEYGDANRVVPTVAQRYEKIVRDGKDADAINAGKAWVDLALKGDATWLLVDPMTEPMSPDQLASLASRLRSHLLPDDLKRLIAVLGTEPEIRVLPETTEET